MLVHLRRSLVMAVICLVFFGFVYAFAGTGVAQVFFTVPGQRFDDEERFTADRPELVQPEVVPRSSRRHRTLRRQPSTPSGGDNPLVANGHDGESAATNLGPRSRSPRGNTKALVCVLARSSASIPPSTW